MKVGDRVKLKKLISAETNKELIGRLLYLGKELSIVSYGNKEYCSNTDQLERAPDITYTYEIIIGGKSVNYPHKTIQDAVNAHCQIYDIGQSLHFLLTREFEDGKLVNVKVERITLYRRTEGGLINWEIKD